MVDGERYVTPARAAAKETRLPAAVGEISLRSSPEGTCGWGHLNSFSARGGEDLNKDFPKIQMPWGLPGGEEC